MSEIVTSSAEARQACTEMNRLINGQLKDDIDALNRQGQILSEPAKWNGPRARQFRQDWQELHRALLSAHRAIDELRENANRITEEIMRAGGA